MKKYIVSVVLFVCMMILTACGEDETEQSILDVPVAELKELMEVSETEELLLGSISRVLVDSEGSMIIQDFQLRQVHAVDADGNYIQQIGASGSGPGEYNFPGVVTMGDDGSIHILDFMTRNIHSYKKSGSGWEFDKSFAADFSKFGFFSQFYTTGNGEFLIISNPMSFDDDGEIVVRKIDRSNEILEDSLKAFKPGDRFMIMTNGVPSMAMSVDLFHRQGRFQVDNRGNMYYGRTDSLRIMKRPVGETKFRDFISEDISNLSFTSERQNRIMENYANNFQDNAEARRNFRSEFPETMNVFRNFMVDDMGNVWVHMVTAEEDAPNWIKFNGEGQAELKVKIPEGNRLHSVRNGKIYLSGETEDELPAVRVMELAI